MSGPFRPSGSRLGRGRPPAPGAPGPCVPRLRGHLVRHRRSRTRPRLRTGRPSSRRLVGPAGRRAGDPPDARRPEAPMRATPGRRGRPPQTWRRSPPPCRRRFRPARRRRPTCSRARGRRWAPRSALPGRRGAPPGTRAPGATMQVFGQPRRATRPSTGTSRQGRGASLQDGRSQIASEQAARGSVAAELARGLGASSGRRRPSRRKQAILAEISQLQSQNQVMDARGAPCWTTWSSRTGRSRTA
jgi:hypothetical protein